MVNERNPPRPTSPGKPIIADQPQSKVPDWSAFKSEFQARESLESHKSTDWAKAFQFPSQGEPVKPPLKPTSSQSQCTQSNRAADKTKPNPLVDRTNTPEFGKVSPVRNPIEAAKQRSATHGGIFNMSRPIQPRPESQRSTSHTQQAKSTFTMPYGMSTSNPPNLQATSASAASRPVSSNPQPISNWPPQNKNQQATKFSQDVVEIPKPANIEAPKSTVRTSALTVSEAPRPVYSMSGGFQPVNTFKPAAYNNVVDLTQPEFKGSNANRFDPNKAVGSASATFDHYDPANYVDPVQASENIKNLLEGAFDEDEDDKPKTRLRKQAPKIEERSAADELADKIKGLKVDGKQSKQQSESKIVEEEEEEEDDGSVEGLTVKLLPHQIDGVTWMLDKEIGERKRNGVLPKGGILADDVRALSFSLLIYGHSR